MIKFNSESTMTSDVSGHPPWMSVALRIAGIYNIAFGAWAVFFPLSIFAVLDMEAPLYPFLWQCIGMIVGVYGLGYLAAAADPLRHWPIIMVGMLGKIFGPIGFLQTAIAGDIPWSFGFLIITNDLIWWIPFGLILLKTWQNRNS